MDMIFMLINLVLVLGAIVFGVTLSVLGIKCMLKYLKEDKK